jgi:aminoglycoside phosphotransferase (APT) family kinase protein
MDGEAALVRHAHAGGVPAPEIVAELTPEDGFGIGFIMRCLPGTASPPDILAQAADGLIDEIAGALAAIHRLDTAPLGFLPRLDPAEGVEGLAAQFEEAGGDRPVIALGLAWLRANLPPPCPPRVVHGDLRLGNILVDQGHLSGVLDWELAHLGDSHEDLAYGCMTVWRFGRLDRPAFGLAALEHYFAAYRAAGGESVDPVRFRFWLVYRTVWWALGCMAMAQSWRARTDRSLERVVISRRTSEQELDLLLLLEEGAPEAERARALPPSARRRFRWRGERGRNPHRDFRMAGRSSQAQAGRARPVRSGRRAQRAGHRPARTGRRPDPADRALADDVLAGRATLATPGLLARLRRAALDRLAADMPKYPALAPARAQWEQC